MFSKDTDLTISSVICFVMEIFFPMIHGSVILCFGTGKSYFFHPVILFVLVQENLYFFFFSSV